MAAVATFHTVLSCGLVEAAEPSVEFVGQHVDGYLKYASVTTVSYSGSLLGRPVTVAYTLTTGKDSQGNQNYLRITRDGIVYTEGSRIIVKGTITEKTEDGSRNTDLEGILVDYGTVSGTWLLGSAEVH